MVENTGSQTDGQTSPGAHMTMGYNAVQLHLKLSLIHKGTITEEESSHAGFRLATFFRQQNDIKYKSDRFFTGK